MYIDCIAKTGIFVLTLFHSIQCCGVMPPSIHLCQRKK